MPMTCPRCQANVPDDAHYCPYCSLPKPKGSIGAAANQTYAEAKSTAEPKSTVGSRKTEPAVSRPHSRSQKPDRKLRLPVLAAAVLAAMLCIGGYIYVLPLVRSQVAEPKSVLAALEKLRRMPSNEPGVTIDARMSRELERFRRVGNLASYQGWTSRPIKGAKSKVILVFSYREASGVEHRAEWLADLTNSTFTPQTELAIRVSN